MSYLDDLRGDWRYTPGVVEVVYTSLDNVAQGGVRAENGTLSFREITTGETAGIQNTDRVWTVWDETIIGEPEQGATVTESDGTVWTILSVEEIAEESATIKWRCVSRKNRGS